MENSYVSNKPLSILKASLPFLPSGYQKTLSYFVKIEEFNIMCNSFNRDINSPLSVCEAPYDTATSRKEMINAISEYLNDSEKELINTFYNLSMALNLYSGQKNKDSNQNTDSNSESGTANGINLDVLKNMLSPSQKAMFDKCSSLINSEGGIHV